MNQTGTGNRNRRNRFPRNRTRNRNRRNRFPGTETETVLCAKLYWINTQNPLFRGTARTENRNRSNRSIPKP